MNKKEAIKEAYASYVFLWLLATSRKSLGTNVFEKDWDVLLILDTCRTDALSEVSDEYDYIENVDEIWSVGSTSKEWVEQTFTQPYAQQIKQTAYITANPFSNTLLGERERTKYGTTDGTWIEKSDWAKKLIKDNAVKADSFGHIEPLWVDTDSNKRFAESQMPESVTAHTIKATRSGEYDRVIAHYMQPHSPYFVSSKNYDDLLEYEKHPFRSLKNGNNEETVWNAYLDNLRFVLDSIETLVRNIDGKVVISADHGELFGELGMYYHMPGNFHPKLKRVPWAEVTATDEQTFDPNVSLEGINAAEEVTEEQLEALGYL